jgi:hypothetical protein
MRILVKNGREKRNNIYLMEGKINLPFKNTDLQGDEVIS